MAKKLMSALMALIIIVGLIPTAGAEGANDGPRFSDMPDNWSTEALRSAVENGLLEGANGKIMPDAPLTRAQMAAIIVRAFGATEEGDISSYTDVKDKWFTSYLAKAYKMGVMEGYAGKMYPDDNITREQAFTVLARALKLTPAAIINVDFSDINELSDWARGHVYAMVNAGYIQGSNGKLNPKSFITRAQFAQVMFNLFKQYINKAGEYTEVAEGNIMVNVPGVTLKGLTVKGDLVLGDGVGDGDVVLEDVTVTGRLVVRGGGENSVVIRGKSSVAHVVVARVYGVVRVSVEGEAEVELIYIDDGSDDVIIEGDVGEVELVADNITVTAAGANIGSANITGVNSKFVVGSSSNVGSITVRSADVAISVEGNVDSLTTYAANTGITGSGIVKKVYVKQGGDGAGVRTPNTEISVDEGVSGVTAGGGKEVEGGKTVKNNNDGSDIVTPPTGGGTYTPPVIPKEIQGSFVPTGNVGIAPDSAGEAAGKIYAEYELKANGETISLAEGNVNYIRVKYGEQGEWQELEPNADSTLWFDVEKAKGNYVFEVKATDGTIYKATLDWQEEIRDAVWAATGREGEHGGETYVEFKLMDDGTAVSLKAGDVKLIAVKDGEKWISLEPNTDENLWFNKERETGSYDYFIVTHDGVMYKATLSWIFAIAAEVDYNAVWNGDRNTWYIKVTVPGEELDVDSVQSIHVIKEAGQWLEDPRELTPDSDKVMWFGVAGSDGLVDDKESGEYAYKVTRKDGSKYIFCFVYDPALVQGVELEAHWKAVGAGINTIDGKDYVFQGFELLDSQNNRIDLVASNIEKITVLEPNSNEPKTLTVGDDSDPLLWFNVQKATGDYKYTVVTKAGVTYVATLNWTAPAEVDAVKTGEPAYNQDRENWYQLYTVEVDVDPEDSKVYQIKPDGEISELTVLADADNHLNIWFRLYGKDGEQQEGEHIFLIKKGDTWSKAVIDYGHTTAEWKDTGKVGTNTIDGKAYVFQGYELLDAEGKRIDLVANNIESMTVLEPGASEPKTLTVGDDSDPLLWFNVQKATGDYKYTVVTKAGVTYVATLNWTAPAEVNAVKTGEPAYNQDRENWYQLYTVEVDVDPEDSKVYQIKPDGEISELTVLADADNHLNIWFRLYGKDGEQQEGEHIFLIKKGDTWSKAVIDHAYLTATWRDTGRVGVNTVGGKDYVFQGFELLDSQNNRIDLVASNIEKIEVLEPGTSEPKTLAVGDDSDPLLWFNVQKASGEYKYTVITRNGVTYVATLNWTAPVYVDAVKSGDPAYNQQRGNWYQLYTVEVDVDPADSRVFQIKPDGKISELTVLADADSHLNIWFRIYGQDGSQQEGEHIFLIKKGNTWSKAVIDHAYLTATWRDTGRVGVNTVGGNDYVFQGFELLDARGNHIDLVASNIEKITVLEPNSNEPKTLTVGDDSDPLLWFNVQKVAGEYDYTVVTKTGAVYTATLNWAGTTEVTAAPEGMPQYNETLGATYQKYIVDGVTLVDFDVMYQIKPSGRIIELFESGDDCLWFKIESDDLGWKQEEGDHIFLVRHNDNWSRFVINYTLHVDTTWYNAQNNKFTLTNASELAGLAKLVNKGIDFRGKTISLGADIDLQNIGWTPIGTAEKPFRGKFDGNGKTIFNLKVNTPDSANAGLFGYISDGALSNVNLSGVRINAKERAGSLAGTAFRMAEPIVNVHVSDVVINSTHYAGGIVGHSFSSVVDCSADNVRITLTFDADINDNGDKAGGITGYQGEGNYVYKNIFVTNSYISGVRDVGGVIGACNEGVSLINCQVSTSTVEADNTTHEHKNPYAGGVVGRAAGKIHLSLCIATDVSVGSYKEGYAGELVGGPAGNWITYNVSNITKGTLYNTIQESINEASDGDTILVGAGTYKENLIIDGKAISLLSAAGRENTIIAPDSTQTIAVEIRGTTDGLRIGAEGQGFTIIGCVPTNPAVETAPLYIKGTHSNLVIEDNEIIANGDCGLLTEYASVLNGMRMIGNIFSGKTFQGDTPAGSGTSEQYKLPNVPRILVYVSGPDNGSNKSDVVFEGNQVTGTAGGLNENGLPQGNTLVTLDAVGVVIRNNSFYGNTARLGAASLRARGINTVIEDNKFYDSELLTTHVVLGAGTVNGGVDAVLRDNTFENSVVIEGYNAIFSKIQAAVDSSTAGDNIIKVHPGDYGTGVVGILQKEGVNIIIEAAGDVTLENRFIIDGAARAFDSEYVTIKGFVFDFSEADSDVNVISTGKLDDRTSSLIYAHNVTIEDCMFIGNSAVNVVAVAAGTPGGHVNFLIRDCTGIDLHSLGQMYVNGVRIENCTVAGGEGGLNLQNSRDITIMNLTVSADKYGVRAGQSSGEVNKDNMMRIVNCRLNAEHPVWLRGDAPGTVVIINSGLSAEDIRNDTGEVNILFDPAAHNIDLGTYYMTIQDAVAEAKEGNTVLIYAGTHDISSTLNVHKRITVEGVDKETVILRGSRDIETTVHLANGATLRNVTVTRDNTGGWTTNKNNNLVAFGQNLNSVTTLENCIIKYGRNGVLLNDTANAVIRNNLIDNNRTGIQMQNQVNAVVESNTITNNHTIGVLLQSLKGGNAHGVPSFRNNVIKDNWYSDFENRWETEYVVDLNGNTFTDATCKIAGSSGEPGYDDLHPVELGGTATRPLTRVTFVSKVDGNIQYEGLNLIVMNEEELRAALNAANVKSITLGADIDLSRHVNLNNNEGLVLDGNGKTIRVSYDGTNPCGFYINSDNVTIKGVIITGDPRTVGIDTKAGTKGFTVENVTFQGLRIGFYANPNTEGEIRGCYFNDLSIGIGYGKDAQLSIKHNEFSNLNKYLEIFGKGIDDPEIIAILQENLFDVAVKQAEQETPAAIIIIEN